MRNLPDFLDGGLIEELLENDYDFENPPIEKEKEWQKPTDASSVTTLKQTVPGTDVLPPADTER